MLASESTGGNTQHRYYKNGEIHNLSEGSNSSTFFRGEEVVLAEQQTGTAPKP
jgi:hypothetical protein